MVRNYDPKSVTKIIAGQILAGYAEGTFVSVERNEDSANLSIGSQGEGTRTVTRNRSGRVTLTLQQTSPSNGVLDAQRIAMELSGGGIFSMLGKDADSGDTWAGATSWVVKPATMEFSNETSNREWIVETDELQMTILGQSA